MHDYRGNQLVFWSSQKKMTDIAQDDEGDVSAHRPSGFTVQIKYVRMVLNWLL